MAPVGAARDASDPHGVVVDIAENKGELPEPIEYPGMEPISPDMARLPVSPIVCPGETTQEPAHYGRQAFPRIRANFEMDMVAHYAEVEKFKAKFPLRMGEACLEQITNLSSIQSHFPTIDSGSDVIPGAVDEYAGLSHMPSTSLPEGDDSAE